MTILPASKVLIIEDVDSKFSEVKNCLTANVIGVSDFYRAKNLNEAEDYIMGHDWNLIILDLSMDIAAAGSYDLTSGHATLGGLDILERMALLKIEFFTILVTGFDSFQDPDRFDNSIMSLSDVNKLAEQHLGSKYVGSVRYGSDGWYERLTKLIEMWREL